MLCCVIMPQVSNVKPEAAIGSFVIRLAVADTVQL